MKTPLTVPDFGDEIDGGVVTQLVEAMSAAWKAGERPLAEEFLTLHPELDEEEAIRLVFEEACLRHEAGQESPSSEIIRRFPQWRSKLALLFEGNRLLRAEPSAVFPEVGEVLGDFRLLAELGRGGAGRTFLASQSSLVDRPVVLKVTALGHEEHLSLARLQHMHIVPLYFELVVPDRNLQIMCMPYLGGTSLARILDALDGIPVEHRSGRDFLEALDRCAIDEPPVGPFRKYLVQATYVQAVCWVGACLADALQYAHDRGLVHMDVKPSNVLVAGDGQPMLLDFHLARGPVGPDMPAPDRLGGTPGFMSPEQREAIAAIYQGRPITVTTDGRSDIYSLGLSLFMALGGDIDTAGSPTMRPLERTNSTVSTGLSDIVRQCLAHDPGDRYRDAASLAIDLRRHLNDLPLRGVANRSLAERWRKWRRRRPAALSRGLFRIAAAVSILAVVAVSVELFRQRIHEVETLLMEGREHLRNHRYSEAKPVLERGLRLASLLPPHDWRKQALRADLQRALRARTAAELNDLVDLLRFRSGINPPTPEEAESLFRRGQEIWKKRGLLTDRGVGSLGNETELQVRRDLLDLATICADLRMHGVPRERSDEARRDAVKFLRDAERQYGPNPALSRDLRSYAADPEAGSMTTRTPRTAWEHYEMGRSYLRSGEYALAEADFLKAVELQPGEFWPNFFQGVCAYRLGRYQDAVASLSICVALAPRTAECYYNRGVANEALGHDDRALGDYSRALSLNPHFADAALNRGVLSYRNGRYTDALHDLELAWTSATSRDARGQIQYNLALVHLARKEPDAARQSMKLAIEYGNDAARDLYDRLGP